jgi:hypothetical protein
MATATWTVDRTLNPRFPFRIAIEQGGRTVLAVRARAPWPGPGENIFCVRERELDLTEHLERVESVPVSALTHIGRKLAIVLDRSQRKRCEFLTVERQRANGDGSYEQIFFRTDTAIRAHRSRTRVELRGPASALSIAIDSTERYAWKFPGATVVQRKLRVGDYALLDGERVAAVVERKTFDNFLGDIGSLQSMHHHWADLAAAGHSAVVIEAAYGDFVDATRLKDRWPASHVARVIAELAALHPRLPIVFAGNRKLAILWTQQFFAAVSLGDSARSPQLVMEALARYDAMPRGESADERVRRIAVEEMEEVFSTHELQARCNDVKPAVVVRIVKQLEKEGKLVREGRGCGTRWSRP